MLSRNVQGPRALSNVSQVVTFVAHALKVRAAEGDCKDAASQDSDIIAEGRALYRSVGDWLPSHDVTAPRVWAGDRIYQNAAQVGLCCTASVFHKCT